MPEPSPHRDEIIQALKNGESISSVAERFPVARRTIERYAKQLKEGRLEEKPKKKEGGKLATVVGKTPAPVIFQLGEQTIELEPQSLYESYLLYGDLRARGLIQNDGFSAVLRDGVGLIWRFLVTQPVIEDAKVKVLEETHGGSTGQGEAEPKAGREPASV